MRRKIPLPENYKDPVEYVLINDKNVVIERFFFKNAEDFYKSLMFEFEYLKNRGLSLNNIVYISEFNKPMIEKTLGEVFNSILQEYQNTINKYSIKKSSHNYRKSVIWFNRYNKLKERLK